MMPVRSVESSPGHRVFEFTCEVCGAPACASEGTDLLRAIKTGKVEHAGRWFCGFKNGQPYCKTQSPPPIKDGSP